MSTHFTPHRSQINTGNSLHSGLADLPTTPEARKLVQELLEKDRQLHHCFYNDSNFHNHLSHHLLAVYDLGGSGPLIQAIYDKEESIQVTIDDPVPEPKGVRNRDVTITVTNWTQCLGIRQLYASYLAFFSAQVEELGVVEAFNQYLFSESATQARMLSRLFAGLCHPLIQLGYGAEFGGSATVAQGLAQAAVHGVLNKHEVLDPAKPTTAAGTPILEIAKQFYDSDDLVPPPYDPHPTPGKVNAIMTMDGVKPEKIRELCAKWLPSGPLTNADIDAAVEDLSWLATLLSFCTSKRGHKHRLDFFLMHILNATTFIPSLLQNIPNMENKRQFIQSYLSFELLYAIFRGRPRIDCEVIMQYRLTPRFKPEDTNATDAIAPTETDPWLGIIQEVVHAKDAHTVKAVRALYIFARRYGTKQAGDIPGAEMFPGGDKLDGSLFVRGARVVLDVMGWVTLGDKEGEWDFSSLGYNEAWEDSPDTQSA